MYSMNLHEKKHHNTLDFPAAYYFVDSAHPQYHMSTHWHREWELIRIKQGTLTLHADHTEIVGHAGDFFLIRDGMLHGAVPENCVYECLLFDFNSLLRSSELIQKYLRPIYRLELLPELLYPANAYPELHAMVAELMDANAVKIAVPEASDYRDLITYSGLNHLFARILQKGLYTTNKEPGLKLPNRIGQIKSVLEYIDQQYQSAITLNSMAEVAGMNPKYFCRIFKEITQQTPMDYVIFFRIEQAAKLLSTTDLSVLEIAMECGFNDCSYFIRTFKKLKHVTPKQYRKR